MTLKIFNVPGKDIAAPKVAHADENEVLNPLHNLSSDDFDTYVPKKWNASPKNPLVPSMSEKEMDQSLKLVRIRVGYKVNNSKDF